MKGITEPGVCISIVSHGQGFLIYSLLCDIMKMRQQISEVIVTLNIPENEAYFEGFRDKLPLRILRNNLPKGFGANHNEAFKVSKAPIFIIINPDVRFSDLNLNELIDVAIQPSNGVAAPIAYSSDGKLQDSARKFPTVRILLERRLRGIQKPDYLIGYEPISVDWVSGMFMVFRRDVFERIGGFDDGYFMYFEDVDICRRLSLLGLRVVVVPQTIVIHNAQHASRLSLRYFKWHLSSAIRYFYYNSFYPPIMETEMHRNQIAETIIARLKDSLNNSSQQWKSSGPINHFIVDNVLPVEIAQEISSSFPSGNSMQVKKSLRELKYVAAQMDHYNPILEEVLFAFQDSRIVSIISDITGLSALEPDEHLYAGGISMMNKGHFLNPHLDNSHDKERCRYRVLNLLYYVSEDWGLNDGGNLELWPDSPSGNQVTIESRFNRLAVMITNSKSWHSVSPVKSDRLRRCISNYYFSEYPADKYEYFHVTSFRGRPEQFIRDIVLRVDTSIRMGLRKIFPNGLIKTTHFYKKD